VPPKESNRRLVLTHHLRQLGDIRLRQLGDIRRDPPRFIPREQFRRRSFARGLYDGRDHEREFGRSFSGKVIAVREIVILKFVDRGNEV